MTGSDLVRLNRLLIEDVFGGIRDLPKSAQFREYFIKDVDYEIADLDWPGEYDPSIDSIHVAWLGTTIGPDTVGEDAEIARQLFEQVGRYADPIVNPEVTYAQGAPVNNVVNDILAGADQPPLYIVMSPAQYYSAHSFMEVYSALVTSEVAGEPAYTGWEDLTQTEQVNAILDYLGYEKLFDVQFLSGFKKTVYVEAPPSFSYDAGMYATLHDEVDGLTISQLGAKGVAVVSNASVTGVKKVGGETYELGSAGAMLDGAVIEYGDDEYFVAGTFVDSVFEASPQFELGSALLSAGIGLNMDSHEINKKYFDFWFAEFEPFEWDGTGDKTADAEAHFLPPYYLLDEAIAAIDFDETLVGEFLQDGELALSDQAAADYAEIVRSGFTVDGVVMNREQAEHIYTLVAGAIGDLDDQFFIAGRDYNEDYSNPDKAAYIASFFEREDTILGVGDWKKLYSPTEGLGRINRNLEGIPTATFWDLDLTGDARVVEPYELDDGSDIFLRVPKDWWENYTVQALGNNNTEPDGKKLQYVGNVDTYDETVGYMRNVVQLEYTQAWSSNVVEPEPADPSVGDLWVVDDYDSSPGRWVVTYREGAHPDWPDEYTAYEQYSINDGRETDEAILPYVYAIFTGLITLGAEETGTLKITADEGLDLMYFLFDTEVLDEGLIAEMFVAGDRSVTMIRSKAKGLGCRRSIRW